MTWYLVSGKTPEKVRMGMKSLKGQVEVLPSVEGVSFYARIADGEEHHLDKIAKDFELTAQPIAGHPPAQSAPINASEAQKEDRVAAKGPLRKELLLNLLPKHPHEQICEMYGITQDTLRQLIKTIPEAQNIYTCYCSTTFTGQNARLHYIGHCKQCAVHKARSRKKIQTPKSEPMSADETLGQAVKVIQNRMALFDQEVARLEAEKARAVAEWDEKIAAKRAQKEKLSKEILDSIAS